MDKEPFVMRCYIGQCLGILEPKSKDGTAWWCPICDSYVKVTKQYYERYLKEKLDNANTGHS